MIMYRAWYNEEIEPVEVVKRTAHYITYKVKTYDGEKETRDKISSGSMKYFDTWLEAKNYLYARTLHSIEVRENQLIALREKLCKIKSMEEPCR